MKHTVLLVVFSLLFFGFQKSTTNFAGKWELDLKRSKDLPPSFKAVEQYVMDIHQAGDSMVVLVELKGSGQDVKFPSTVYTFSGSEVFRQDTLRGSKRWSTAKWAEKGKKLTVTSRVEQRGMGREVHYRQTDVWELRGDGMLQVSMTQKFTPGDSTYAQRRYFRRMK